MQAERQGTPINQQLGRVARQTPFEQKIGRAARDIFNRAVEVGKAVAMLPFSCGYVSPLTGSRDLAVHDHDGRKMVSTSKGEVPYNPKVHGELKGWKEEGDTVHEVRDKKSDEVQKRWVHDHSAKSGNAVYEYRVEKV